MNVQCPYCDRTLVVQNTTLHNCPGYCHRELCGHFDSIISDVYDIGDTSSLRFKRTEKGVQIVGSVIYLNGKGSRLCDCGKGEEVVMDHVEDDEFIENVREEALVTLENVSMKYGLTEHTENRARDHINDYFDAHYSENA